MIKQKNKNIIYGVIIIIVLLAVDQIAKQIISTNNINITILPNILEIQAIHNMGGAFGVAQGNIAMFIVTNLVVLGLIIRFICLQKDFMDKSTLYILCVILAGGFGNLIDRITRGYVVDFINVFPKLNLPIFNLADIYITLGWIFLAFIFARYTYKEIKNIKR